jgi:formylglycine-generating enzyme required for sulfatase activity
MRVSITRPYWIGKFEVTQGQWESVMGYNPSSFKNVGRTAPVDSVSYTDAMSFCRRLTERERAAGRLPEGYEYALPTEAQWEYACRAGRSGAPVDDLKVAGWYSRNSGKSTHPVGQQRPNEWGLYDMRGNVWEWCSDWMDDFPADSTVDPLGASTGRNKAARGGGWDRPHDYCTPSFRGQFTPASISGALGFRLALVPVRITPSS